VLSVHKRNTLARCKEDGNIKAYENVVMTNTSKEEERELKRK
jgi:hypothetical protein